MQCNKRLLVHMRVGHSRGGLISLARLVCEANTATESFDTSESPLVCFEVVFSFCFGTVHACGGASRFLFGSCTLALDTCGGSFPTSAESSCAEPTSVDTWRSAGARLPQLRTGYHVNSPHRARATELLLNSLHVDIVCPCEFSDELRSKPAC